MDTRIYPLTHFAKSMVYSVKLYWNSTKDVFGLLFMPRVFTAHFSPMKCSKTIFRKRAKPLASYRGTIQSGNSIKCLRNAPDTHILSISFLLQVSSLPISIIYQCVNHVPNPLTWRGYSRATVPCFNFSHCPLSAGSMCGNWYTKANMAV